MSWNVISTNATPQMSLAPLLRTVVRWAHGCVERRRQRIFLAQLDAHGLSDIGLTRGDVARETEKPFWR